MYFIAQIQGIEILADDRYVGRETLQTIVRAATMEKARSAAEEVYRQTHPEVTTGKHFVAVSLFWDERAGLRRTRRALKRYIRIMDRIQAGQNIQFSLQTLFKE